MELFKSYIGNNKNETDRTSRYIFYQILLIKKVNKFITAELN